MTRLIKLKYIVCFIITVLLFTQRTYGDIPPAVYDKKKKDAPEKFQIKILKTETSAESKNGYTQIVFTASVTKVIATKSDIKVNDEIKIHCSTFTGSKGQPLEPSPAHPPILKKGWTGPAFLKCHIDNKTKEKKFKLAAFGKSFEKIQKKSGKQADKLNVFE